MAKTGRPRKEIDKRVFENLCRIQTTKDEACCFFRCDDRTIDRWCKREYGQSFDEVYKIYRGEGKISLRRNLIHLAEKNPSVAIFLAKNELGYSDQPRPTNEGEKSLMQNLIDIYDKENKNK